MRLADQDRRLWDEALIDEGRALVPRALAPRGIGPYALQAAIAALHAEFSLGRLTLMANDSPPDRYQPPQGVSVQLGFDNPDPARRAFERLCEGGQVRMPFEPTFWARGFGMLVDRFGIPWMINCD